MSWGFVFVVATIVGGAIAALTGGEFAKAGLVAGSWIFAELSGRSKRTVETWGDFGEVMVPDLLRLPRVAFAIGLAVALTIIILVLERFTIR